jgi:hypothetical protein
MLCGQDGTYGECQCDGDGGTVADAPAAGDVFLADGGADVGETATDAAVDSGSDSASSDGASGPDK